MNMLDLFQSLNWEVVGIAATVTALVYGLKWVKMVKNGDVARVTTLLIAALLSGLDTETSQAMIPVVAGLAATLYELIEFLIVKFQEYRKTLTAKK